MFKQEKEQKTMVKKREQEKNIEDTEATPRLSDEVKNENAEKH